MLQFWLALILFIASHSVIARTPLRRIMVGRLGERGYLIVYALLSLALFIWLIAAAVHAPRTPLWPWIHALYWIPNIFMPLAFILLAAGFAVPSPLSIIPRENGFDPEHPSLTIAITRHPVMWGFFLWSASHIPPNGEFPLALMFAIFALFAALGMPMIDKKRRRELGEDKWKRLSINTRDVIFSASSLWQGRFAITHHDAIGIACGLVLYLVFFFLHPYLIGVSPVPPL